MLLIFAVVAGFAFLGFLAVAKVAQLAMSRLGLEFWSVALWLGLAEARVDELAARRAAPVRDSVRDRHALVS